VEIETNWADELWIKDAQIENISGAAFSFAWTIIAQRNQHGGNRLPQCSRFRALIDSGKLYRAVRNLFRQQIFAWIGICDIGAEPKIQNQFDADR